jgi:tripartite ATP-independent transporter DctM subunit
MIWTALVILLGLLVIAVPISAGMGVLSIGLSSIYSDRPLLRVVGELTWSTSNDFLLVAIPFFILLGELLLRSGMAERMYKALILWMPWLPGGLMHTNIAACALFAATSGSSVATAATIGTVAMGEIDKHGYSERLFLGTIAAGGTLGILIPPSINMIVYGILTDTSIPRLYLAGITPGLFLAGLFSLMVVGFCILRPESAGKRTIASWEDRLRALPDLVPPVVIFLVVIGSIYVGWATATEAAGLGVIAALAVAAWNRQLTLSVILRAFEGSMRTTAMIMAIILAAYILNFVFSAIGLARQLNTFIVSLSLTPVELLIAVVILYTILGMFLETLSMMVLTVPIIAPVLFQAGYDPVWVGILIVIMMELGMITPPVGMNLFVVQGLRKRGKIHDVIIGATPFMVAMLLLVIIISIWPELVLWLPRAMKG